MGFEKSFTQIFCSKPIFTLTSETSFNIDLGSDIFVPVSDFIKIEKLDRSTKMLRLKLFKKFLAPREMDTF